MFLISTMSAWTQTVDCSRTAILNNGAYNLSGTAVLERIDSANLHLRLESDFLTDSGPDVQIFLTNDSTNVTGGAMIADIGSVDGLSHFEGALTLPVLDPSIEINQYQYIVFRCITFAAFWGGGKWSVPTCEQGEEPVPQDSTLMTTNCMESGVATLGWQPSVTVCPNDEVDDIVQFLNTADGIPGQNYAYVFVDANNNIKKVHHDSSYNFEGSSLEPDFIFGVSYEGELQYELGDPLSSITADSCAIISNNMNFLTVNKENCRSNFDCLESATATTNWATFTTVCPNDGIPDTVPFLNNLFAIPGENYAYVITDTFNRIQDVHFETFLDFEGSGLEAQRVYGVSFSGNLNYSIGNPLSSISADTCLVLSDTTRLFLTVLKEDCQPVFDCLESATATTNWVTSIIICPNDGIIDSVPLLNNLFAEPGNNYAYVITDTFNQIQDVHFESNYNFEGTGLEPNRVFGISYSGMLSYEIGDPLASITADTCLMLSDTSRLFLTVLKEDCLPAFECLESNTATTGWVTSVSICSNDGFPDSIPLMNNLFMEPGDNYAYIVTDTLNKLISVHFDSNLDFEGSGSDPNRVFGLSYSGTLNYQIGDHISLVTADSCYVLSDTTSLFLTVIKDACTPVDSALLRIGGTITNESGDPISGVIVMLDNDLVALTDEMGMYAFDNLPNNNTYNILPLFDDASINGVSSIDLVITARHILGESLFDSPYTRLAADVNNSGTISSADLVQLRLLILGRVTNFPTVKSWRFIDATQDLSTDSEAEPKESINISLGETDRLNVNFIGVKMGDVNGSANLNLRE